MVDPIFTYVGGIAFLVLIIGSMLYLTFSTADIEEGDEHPGESVVGGITQAEEESEGVEVANADAEESEDAETAEAGEAEPEADEDTDEAADDADDEADEETDETSG